MYPSTSIFGTLLLCSSLLWQHAAAADINVKATGEIGPTAQWFSLSEREAEYLGGVFAAVLKANSNAKSPYLTKGQTEGWLWKARGIGGGTFDTTAESDTINGALQKHFRTNGRNAYVDCIQVDHGGQWTGVITLGRDGLTNRAQVDGADCARDRAIWNKKLSGGKNDCAPGTCNNG